MPVVNCKICGKKFSVRPSHLKMGWGKYCSRKCHHDDMKTGKKIFCFICGREVYRSPTRIIRSKSQKHFCSKSCQTKWRNTQYVGPKHLNWKNGKSAYRSVLARNGIKAVCSHCGISDTRILAVHHVDENHLNNDARNLAWLCHNCHYLVHHDNVERRRFLVKHKS